MAPVSNSNGACNRPDLAEQLLAGNPLDATERAEVEHHVDRCPSCGPNQRLLQEAQAWLVSQLPEQRAAELGECPSADELYQFGHGPGTSPLNEQRQVAIADHVAHCRDCDAWVATLAQRPPVPLDLAPPQEECEGAEERAAHNVQPLAWRRRWIPLAAAALILITVGVYLGPIRAGGPGPALHASGIVFPTPDVLRGTSARGLYFPRDRVLSGETRGLHQLRFELAEREEASLYRVFLMQNVAGAFDRGQTVATLESDGTTLTFAYAQAELAPGTYTWEGWAIVRGLETFLGRRDFEVVEDAELRGELDRLAGLDEPLRSTETLALLHRRGHSTDARAYARALPQTPERDAYLNNLPGR